MSTTIETAAPARYRISAILSGLAAMWRAAGPALLAIVINAAIQAALMYLDVQSGFSIGFLASFVVSAAAAMALYAVLTAAALESVDGTASFASVLARSRRHILLFAVWTIVQWTLIVMVALVHVGLILLVAALTPFLPLAAMDGHRAAMVSNFRAVGARFGRWLVTALVLIVAGLVLYLLSAVNTFFVKGTPASVIFWLVIGIVAWWLLTAWALIFRATPVGAREPASD